MKLSQVKLVLENINSITFQLPNGTFIPNHFHVTEVGAINRDFIDCGGTVRHEKMINFQLWEAEDYDHLLAPQKMLSIIQLSEKILKMEDGEVEVEYQGETIGKYGLEFSGNHFVLTSKKTACLASDSCGVPVQKAKINISDLKSESSVCSPGSGCCS